MGVDLSRANLAHANLRYAKLPYAMFQGAYLRGTDFTEAQLEHAYFDTTQVIGTDFTRANLTSSKFFAADMRQVILSGANLTNAFLSKADLFEAQLPDAVLVGTVLTEARLIHANLNGADLSRAICIWADFGETNLRHAILYQTDLTNVRLIDADLQGAELIGCRVYGLSAWDVNLSSTTQADLTVTFYDDVTITVDDLRVAQFIHQILKNEVIGKMVDGITSKTVLILGRFSDERKPVLEMIWKELRKRDYTPVLFDFEKPASRDLTETIVTLAHLSRFIIADITDAKSIPQELQAIVPNLPSVAVQPIILSTQHEYAMFEHFKRFPWVLPIHQYDTQEQLIAELSTKVIQPAEEKVKELRSFK